MSTKHLVSFGFPPATNGSRCCLFGAGRRLSWLVCGTLSLVTRDRRGFGSRLRLPELVAQWYAGGHPVAARLLRSDPRTGEVISGGKRVEFLVRRASRRQRSG